MASVKPSDDNEELAYIHNAPSRPVCVLEVAFLAWPESLASLLKPGPESPGSETRGQLPLQDKPPSSVPCTAQPTFTEPHRTFYF